MKFWPLFSLLLLIQQPILLGQGLAGFADLERKGDDALAAGLWEVAELHFRQRLADPALTTDAKSQVAIRLAESLIRSGNAKEALELLGQSFVAKNPATPFWMAQAMTAENRFSNAVGIFQTLLADPKAPHRTEAGFTQASLQLALGQADAALETLAQLIPDADATTVVKIRLYQVEILLDLKRPEDARQAMPDLESVASTDRPLAAFLDAQLLLAEDLPADAEIGFQELVNHPQGQSLTRFHSAAIGLADAIALQGDAPKAAMTLLTFLQDNPDSPVLEPIFKRILEWLPPKPAPTEPILESLTRWIVEPAIPAILPIDTAQSDAIAAWPAHTADSELTELSAFALYTRAVGVHRTGVPETPAASGKLINNPRALMTRLLLDYPGHMLASRALYKLARWALDEGNVDQAFSILSTLRDTAKSPVLKGEAAFLEARTACLNGDPKKAIQLFDEAAKNLAAPEAKLARLQSAIARLRGGDLNGTTLIQQSGATTDPALAADLELERALATTPPAATRAAIEEFLTRFPDHPRAAEARFAAAEAALASPAPDLQFVRDQLDALTAIPESAAPRVALARLRVADLSKDSAAAIAAAQAIMDTYPADPAAAEAALTLGRNLFQTGSYNTALLALKKLADTETNPARAQVAWLLAARSAALGGTPQSKEEALGLFDKAIESKGSLAAIATLEKAEHIIDLYRLAEASDFLDKWIKTLPEDDPLRLPAGLLLGEALYAEGSGNPASMAAALAVYDTLLAHAKNQPALLNRLQYLRGMTLQQMPDPKDPSKKRETQAFEAFYSVLETTDPPAEWKYFELCGDKALTILEKAKRWQAAVNLARKIASFNGPGAKDAAARASKIQLEQMMW